METKATVSVRSRSPEHSLEGKHSASTGQIWILVLDPAWSLHSQRWPQAKQTSECCKIHAFPSRLLQAFWGCALLWMWFICYSGKSPNPQTLGWDPAKEVNRNEETVSSNRQWGAVISASGRPGGFKPVTYIFNGFSVKWGSRELAHRAVASRGALWEVLFHIARLPKPIQCRRLNVPPRMCQGSSRLITVSAGHRHWIPQGQSQHMPTELVPKVDFRADFR